VPCLVIDVYVGSGIRVPDFEEFFHIYILTTN